MFQFVPDDNNYNLELHIAVLKACGLKLDFDEAYEERRFMIRPWKCREIRRTRGVKVEETGHDRVPRVHKNYVK